MTPAEAPRLFLLLHAIIGGALVASSTHWLIWMRGYWAGTPSRQRGIRRFAAITTLLYGAAFGLGLWIYPNYRIHVRHEYLDNPAHIAEDMALRQRFRTEAEQHEGVTQISSVAVDQAISERAKVVRWFDVKEHWALLGLLCSVAGWILVRQISSTNSPIVLCYVSLGAVAVACMGSWLALIVGILTASYRALGT